MTWIPETPACTALNIQHLETSHDKTTGECLDPPVVYLHHWDGVPWWEAKRHPWWKKCKPQTRGFGIVRCSCGAIRELGETGWSDRRKKKNR